MATCIKCKGQCDLADINEQNRILLLFEVIEAGIEDSEELEFLCAECFTSAEVSDYRAENL